MIVPVLQRELLVRARTKSLYLLRTGTAAAAILVVTFVWAFSPDSDDMGPRIFEALLHILVVFALFEGVRCAASSVVEERTDGTLGLLFLTDLRCGDVLAGKVAGHVLASCLCLVAATPFLALPVLLGGVDLDQCLRGAAVVLNALFLSIALGTWASVRCRSTMAAFFAGYALLAAWLLVPMLLRPFENLLSRLSCRKR